MYILFLNDKGMAQSIKITQTQSVFTILKCTLNSSALTNWQSFDCDTLLLNTV